VANEPRHDLASASATPEAGLQKPWYAEVGDLLAQAAILCVENGLDADTFMRGAWSAYVETRPGMKDYLEELQLQGQLDELRKSGRMGEA